VKILKKNYKKIFGYAIVMLVCVLAIVLIACLSENKLEGYQLEYEQAMTVSQKQIQSLEAEIAKLSKEKAELEKNIEKSMTLQADLTTNDQAFLDMKDIYDLYKSGKKTEAKAAFSKIEPIGFEDMALWYYELLSDVLDK
jgi:cell division protein FtsB